jgi:hypothetical protein
MGLVEALKPSLLKRQKRRDKRLSEELIECYRGGRRIKSAKGYQKTIVKDEFAHALQKESIKLMKGNSKYLTDNLEPMIRFLNSKVGKHWDKVYSELSKKMNKSSMLGKHLNDHLFDFVKTKVIIEDGKVYALHRWSGQQALVSYERYPRFYVHPKSGVLMKAKNAKSQK